MKSLIFLILAGFYVIPFQALASCMFTYVSAKGARMGYLDNSHMEVAQSSFDAILEEFIILEE
jgi:rhamnogalacturonyl hydrolase YesR